VLLFTLALLQGKSQRLVLNPGSYVVKQGQQLLVLATSAQVAEAGAAGEGLEQSQALDAAESAVASAAAPLAHSTIEARSHAVEQQQQQQLVQQPAQPAAQQDQHVLQQQADKQQQQQHQQPQSWQPVVQHRSGASRGVTVRVPSLSQQELQRFTGAAAVAAGAAGAPSEQPRVRVNAAVRGSWQQQQQQQRQFSTKQATSSTQQQQAGYPMYMYQQQQQQQSTPGSSLPAPAAPLAATANLSWVQNIARDVISQPGSRSFSHSSSSIDQLGGLAAPDSGSDVSNVLDDDLSNLNPCLASWSGAFESDSMDETEVCTDSELLEAALLQRQRQQLRKQQQQQYALGQSAGQLPGYEVLQDSEDEGQESQTAAGNQSAQRIRDIDSSSRSGEVGIPTASSEVSRSSSAETAAAAAASSNGISNETEHANNNNPADNQQHQVLSTFPLSNSDSGSIGMHHQQPLPPVLGSTPSLPPKHLRGHIIVSGCASSFVQFAEQLHSLASPAVSPVPLVILHPELPPREVFEALRALGPTYFVRGKSSESAALAAAGAENARCGSDASKVPALCSMSLLQNYHVCTCMYSTLHSDKAKLHMSNVLHCPCVTFVHKGIANCWSCCLSMLLLLYRSLVHLGPSERPTHLSAQAVSGVYGVSSHLLPWNIAIKVFKVFVTEGRCPLAHACMT
jgi:hypothetical protein